MLPIVLRAGGRRAVVVGGGSVAARKAAALATAGFAVVVVAIAIADKRLRALRQPHRLEQRAYVAGDLDGAALAVAATDDAAVNARVVADARAAGILVCDASDPQRGDFHFPATLRRGDLTVCVDSGGASPAFSKRIADEIAHAIGEEYGDAAHALSHMRDHVKAVLPPQQRADILRALAALPVDELAALDASNARERAQKEMERRGSAAARSATPTVVCATRASALAMTQTRSVAARLAQRGIASTLLPLTTVGDRYRDRAIEQIGSANVFVAELEQALRDRRADYAVHSCKDLPSELAADMQIAAISSREDPRDAFCSQHFPSFEVLPPGAVVGTSSPRRRAQLHERRPDLVYEEMRGNVDTRLRKLRDGAYDAIVLAMAGLNRLHLRASHTTAFDVDALVPAAGQGALAVETRRGDDYLVDELHAAVNDAQAELCVRCERAVLRALRAGCNAPVGAYARFEDGNLVVRAAFAALPGQPLRRLLLRRPCSDAAAAEALGMEVAAALTAARARRVILPRTRMQPSRIAAALRAEGVEVVEVVAGDDGPDPAEGSVDMILFPSSGAVSAAASYLSRLRSAAVRPAVVAMGPASAAAAAAAGYAPDAVAGEASIDGLLALVRARLGVVA